MACQSPSSFEAGLRFLLGLGVSGGASRHEKVGGSNRWIFNSLELARTKSRGFGLHQQRHIIIEVLFCLDMFQSGTWYLFSCGGKYKFERVCTWFWQSGKSKVLFDLIRFYFFLIFFLDLILDLDLDSDLYYKRRLILSMSSIFFLYDEKIFITFRFWWRISEPNWALKEFHVKFRYKLFISWKCGSVNKYFEIFNPKIGWNLYSFRPWPGSR